MASLLPRAARPAAISSSRLLYTNSLAMPAAETPIPTAMATATAFSSSNPSGVSKPADFVISTVGSLIDSDCLSVVGTLTNKMVPELWKFAGVLEYSSAEHTKGSSYQEKWISIKMRRTYMFEQVGRTQQLSQLRGFSSGSTGDTVRSVLAVYEQNLDSASNIQTLKHSDLAATSSSFLSRQNVGSITERLGLGRNFTDFQPFCRGGLINSFKWRTTPCGLGVHASNQLQQQRTFVQLKTKLTVADNSGAKVVECIKVMNKTRLARLGDTIIASVKEVVGHGKVKKGEVVYCVVVRARMQRCRSDGSEVRFDDNAAVIINKQGEPVGTRIMGPVSHELRRKKMVKILSLAEHVA